ncbi:uncharacterized protein LOC131648028 [Vicia villosa]|uniref:uncharacterized protein LOC131648028 n=1 Tax=Vicia villosa TaxID=3911 RepID=UPI00273C7C89|nr:uncharacterized protein LOC131648028 [Vicia villosa]
MLAGSLSQIPQANAGNRNGNDDVYRALGKFQRNNPPTFEGEHEPDKAQAWESASHYKAMNEKKGQYRGKPYDNKKKVVFGGKPSGGGSSAPIKCFKCGAEGHRAVDCPKVEVTCFKCGKSGHKANECRGGSKVQKSSCLIRGLAGEFRGFVLIR